MRASYSIVSLVSALPMINLCLKLLILKQQRNYTGIIERVKNVSSARDHHPPSVKDNSGSCFSFCDAFSSAFSSVSQLEEGEINRDAFTRELDYKGP